MDIDSTGPLSSADKAAYLREYKQGADLFQKALQEHSHADNMFKKAELKNVMDESMDVMRQTVGELKRNDLAKQNEKIAKDYDSYQDGGDAEAQKQLAKDLEQAKKMV